MPYYIIKMFRARTLHYDTMSGTFVPEEQGGTPFLNKGDADALAKHLNDNGMSCSVK